MEDTLNETPLEELNPEPDQDEQPEEVTSQEEYHPVYREGAGQPPVDTVPGTEPEIEFGGSTYDSSKNPFLSRGCCGAPAPHQKSNGVYQHRCSKFDTFDWIKSIPLPPGYIPVDIVEVRFKNSRKDFYRIPADMEIETGDIVAVEASPGHDIGIVSISGELIRFQLKIKGIDPGSQDIRKVYRRARLADIEKWVSAVETESTTMFRSREIADRLNLQMKINDVEYQGDNTKAIFYYTADDRVDFRELIKVLAEEFHVRIEMRQIGARQEASRLGGLGTCGRELCCSTWLSEFCSVSTNTARVQQLSLNPQKLAGQCGKLKCCLNYEYDTYMDAIKEFPNTDVRLKTKNGDAIHQKSDIFGKIMWYSYVNDQQNLLAIPLDKVLEIIEENNAGRIPEKLEDFANITEQKREFDNGLGGQDDLTRFDHL
ncbi:MAG: regulatory iron-sulfur-containing complex subunit RicT [Bacteroidetes bacterium]|nr:regulatory iron-sulfur-containing complex subunit RicT [Bacteroidota bacterium]